MQLQNSASLGDSSSKRQHAVLTQADRRAQGTMRFPCQAHLWRFLKPDLPVSVGALWRYCYSGVEGVSEVGLPILLCVNVRPAGATHGCLDALRHKTW